MIGGLPIEYAGARVAARLAQRPRAEHWRAWRAARSLEALLQSVRDSPAAPLVSGLSWPAAVDAVEAAFRGQLRSRIDELAHWAPEDWQPAVRFTRHLLDLPALVAALGEARLPDWVAGDPALADWALADPEPRRAAIAATPLAPIAAAVEQAGAEEVAGAVSPAPATIHVALQAWHAHWRRLWPAGNAEEIAALERVVEQLRVTLLEAARDAAAASRARAALLESLRLTVRRAAMQPAALFAYLALLAFDLEQLRGEFVLRIALEAA